MTDKRTFPGALNAEQREALERQQAAEQARSEEEQRKVQAARLAAAKRAQEQERRTDLVNKFYPKIKGDIAALSFFILLFVNYGIGGIDRAFADFYTDTSFGTEVSIQTGPDLVDAIHEAYDPYFHGAHPDDNEYGEGKQVWSNKSYRSDEINDRWIRHMILLFIEALVLIGVAAKRGRVRRNVDLMLAIEKSAKQHNVDPKQLKKMMKVAPEIVKHMSKESSVYFEMLMDGTLDADSNPKLLGMATSILEGHLQSHPEDYARVVAVFDEQSLPQNIVNIYCQRGR